MCLQLRRLLIKRQLNKQLGSCRAGMATTLLLPLPFWLCAPRVRFSAYPSLQPCLLFEVAQALVLLGFEGFVCNVRASSTPATHRAAGGDFLTLPGTGELFRTASSSSEKRQKASKRCYIHLKSCFLPSLIIFQVRTYSTYKKICGQGAHIHHGGNSISNEFGLPSTLTLSWPNTAPASRDEKNNQKKAPHLL